MEVDWSMENLVLSGLYEMEESTDIEDTATNDHHDAMVQRCERVPQFLKISILNRH